MPTRRDNNEERASRIDQILQEIRDKAPGREQSSAAGAERATPARKPVKASLEHDRQVENLRRPKRSK